MNAACLKTLITYNPWTVSPATTLEEVATSFRRLGLHHVAVVDDQRQLVGMISETDLLQASQRQRATAVAGGSVDEAVGETLVGEVMSAQVLTVTPTARDREALGLLIKHQVHALAVVDDGRLVGMITSRDFIREFSYGETADSREPVSSRLKPVVESLEPEATLDEALLSMQESGVSCLAVAKGGCPLGIVSQRDIVRTRCAAAERPADAPPTRVLTIARAATALKPGQRLCEAAAAIVELDLPAITVVNQANRLLGIITEDDILRVMYDGAA
jgi:CBS domain-containing protein